MDSTQRIKMKKLIIILSAFVLMGMSDADRRTEQNRIEEMIAFSLKAQQQPSPKGSPRINRILKNAYTNCCTNPLYPKTIYREPIRPPFPTGHKRFYGGIPRG